MTRKTVLVVDDDEDSRTICVTILQHHGFEVLEAMDGERGLQLAREVRPDAILMDITLPGIDGWTATSRIKEDPSTASIPVIMLTAHALEADVAQSRTAGCDSYLTKPCSPTLVLAEVQRFTGGDAQR